MKLGWRQFNLLGKRAQASGLSIVELLLGATITLMALGSAMAVFHTLSSGNSSSQMKLKADQKLQARAEEIRQQAIGEFSTLQELDKDRTCPQYSAPGIPFNPADPQQASLCTEVDRRIQVFSNIGPVDTYKRTRDVTLTARWKQGSSWTEKNLSFTIVPLRGFLQGGVILASAVDGITGAPVIGVDVYAPGQSTARVSCVTQSPDGKCTINGAKIGSNIPVTFDVSGNPGLAGYFFPSNPATPDVPPASLNTAVNAASVQPAATTAVSATVFPPGRFSGTVTDPILNMPVPGVRVAAYVQAGTSVVPLSDQIPAQVGVTDTNGRVTLDHLPPGSYSLHLIGNRSYASVGETYDIFPSNRTGFYRVRPGIVTPFTLYTAQKGQASFKVRGVGYKWDSMSVVYDPTLDVIPNPSHRAEIYVAGDEDVETYSNWNIAYGSVMLSWAGYPDIQDPDYPGYPGDQRDLRKRLVSDDQTVTIPYVGPHVLDRDLVDSPYTGQFDNYELLPNYSDGMEDPFTPILVMPRNGNLNTPSLKIMPTSNYSAIYANGGQFDDFWVKMFPDITWVPNNPNQTVYVLTKQSYGNISGVIKNPDNTDFNSQGYYGYVSSQFGNNGWGLLRNQNGKWIIDAQSLVLANGGSATTYDFSSDGAYPVGYFRLPPNLGTDRTVINFKMDKAAVNLNPDPDFIVSFIGFELIQDPNNPNNIIEHTFTNFNPSSTLSLFFLAQSPGTNFNVDYSLSGGNTISIRHSAICSDTVTGQTSPIQVLPGQTISDPAQTTITAVEQTICPEVSVTVLMNDDWDEDGDYSHLYYTAGSPRGTYSGSDSLYIYKRGMSGPISGRVMSDQGYPVAGAIVYITGLGQTSSIQLQTDLLGNFSLPNGVLFTTYWLSYGPSIYATVTKSGYVDANLNTTAYIGMPWNMGNIILQRQDPTVIQEGL